MLKKISQLLRQKENWPTFEEESVCMSLLGQVQYIYLCIYIYANMYYVCLHT